MWSLIHQTMASHMTLGDNIENMLPNVAEYYTGKNVFITGGTGFIGKVLIEKLLRSCPLVNKVYLLMRPKQKQTVEQRLEELSISPVFEKLKKDQPNFAEKFIAVTGNICLPELGICRTEREILEKEIHVVFHSAATIRFDEPLRFAVEMNLLGVRKMINLCKNFKTLEVFVHVSTAYANCDRSFIEEVVYPPSVEPEQLLDSLDWMDDEMFDTITLKLIDGKPNTYTFTKHLAEALLIKEGAGLPLAIVRPSIVGAAWKEPMPGWIDNYNGVSGIYIAAGKGIMRAYPCGSKCVADIVPVDISVNIMIIVAWYTAINKPTNIIIYHSTTGSTNPLTWGEITGAVMNAWKKVPLDQCFRRPSVICTANGFLYDFYRTVSHMIPAYVADFGCYMVGKKQRMVRIYNKLHKALGCVSYFTLHSWQWTYNNMDMLISQMSPEDRTIFYFDPRPLHWPTYLENCCLGLKKFLLNETLTGVPAAKAHLKKLRNIRYTFNTLMTVVLWRTLIARSQIARNLWFFILRLAMKFVKFFRITSTIGT